jgi:hypothetical protein
LGEVHNNALGLSGDDSDLRSALGRDATEGVRMSSIIEDLLWLARYDAEPSRPRELAVEVDRLAHQEGRTRSDLLREAFRQYADTAVVSSVLPKLVLARFHRATQHGGIAVGERRNNARTPVQR